MTATGASEGSDTPVALIVAHARHRVIGLRNRIPWRLPEDLRHFQATTRGHAIVMGRKTFESIGKPLPGRRNIVVSRNSEWRHDGCERAGSLVEALELARDANAPQRPVFVIGGAEIYAQALGLADRLIVTEIDLETEGDVHFPRIDPQQWRERARHAHISASGLRYDIVDYRRHHARTA